MRRIGMRSVVAVIAACAWSMAAAAQSSAEWDKVIAAAKQEGRVVIYSGAPGSPEHREVAKLFEAKYGIKFDVLEGPGSEVQERIRVEGSTGKVAGDVSHIGSTTQVLMQGYGLIAPHQGIPNLGKLVVKPMVPEEVPIFNNTYGLIVNTRLVPPAEEPTSWLDLLEPRWKGRILASPMSASGLGATWFGVMQDAFGTAFHEKLARLEPVFGPSNRENARRVARGEYALNTPFILPQVRDIEGLPVKAIVPKEGVPYTPFSVAVIKGAPHPNAARLLVNFFLEPEAQLVYARSGYSVAVDGLQDRVPEQWRWAVNAKLLGRQKLEGQEERQRLAAKIYEGK
jgi:iron(III) transport system substrate-binding protein